MILLALLFVAVPARLQAHEDKHDDKKEEKKEQKAHGKAPEAETKPVEVEPGVYEIKVSTEDADGNPIGTTATQMHCLTRLAGVGVHGFAVLDPNSPLRNCPARDLRETGDALNFEIDCTSGNPGRAKAYFNVFGAKFRGRIEIYPGNGAEHVAEIQEGRRVASCPVP